MAKKNGRKAGMKIPKQIGGMKLPKELRQAGNSLLEKAGSPAGREIIASGLTMAAAAAVAAAAKHRADVAAGDRKAGEPGMNDPQRVADAVGNVAEAVLDRLFGARRAGQR